MNRYEKLKKAVDDFNTKIDSVPDRLKSIQPEKKDADELYKTFQKLTTSEFDRELRRLGRYLRPGAEELKITGSGAETTQYEYKEIANKINALNQINAGIIKKYNPSTYTGTMGTINKNNLRPRLNRSDTISPDKFREYSENLERQLLGKSEKIRTEKYKDNFLYAIEKNFGSASELYKRIKETDAKDLYRFYHTSPILNISFTSDPQEPDVIQDLMLEELDNLENIDEADYYS